MKILNISFHGTEDMLANMFMKLLPHPKVEHLSKLAGLALRECVRVFNLCGSFGPGRLLWIVNQSPEVKNPKGG
jgi:hypothetical protein